MNSDLVSVIMPVYNVKDYVEAAIKSVIDQTYEKWELIIIDDGSQDGSAEICDRYADQNESITVFHISNQGVGNARNVGISKANGQYIAFVDSDDELEKDFLERMVNSAKESGADMVVCDYRSIGKNFENETEDIKQDYQVLDSKECLTDYLDNRFYVYVIWAKLYKLSVLENVAFRNMKIGEDTCLILDILQKGIKVSFLNYKGYKYRARVDGVTKIKEFNDKDIDRLRIPRIFYDSVKEMDLGLTDRAKDNLCYAFIRTAKEMMNNKDVIRKYRRSAVDIIADIDYMKSTIGMRKKIFICLFKISPMLARCYMSFALA